MHSIAAEQSVMDIFISDSIVICALEFAPSYYVQRVHSVLSIQHSVINILVIKRYIVSLCHL